MGLYSAIPQRQGEAPRRGLTVLFCLLLVGCSRADLRPPELREAIRPESARRGEDLWHASRQSRGLFRWRQQQTARMELEDRWSSTFIRWFTPLEENRQSLEIELTLREPEATLTFRDGPNAGDRIEYRGEATREVRESSTTEGEDSEIVLYLGSFQVYFELPFRTFETMIEIGAAEFGGRSLDRVFLTDGSPEPDDRRDQYVAWIDRDTGHVVRIDFTYRRMFAWYQGTLLFDDYREVDGVTVPFVIRIVDEPDDDEAVHVFTIESLKFGKGSENGKGSG